MGANAGDIQRSIYTIGHSNHSFEAFLELLGRHAIDVLVDVRSAPYSKYAPRFDKRVLDAAMGPSGVKYLFLGKELGGRPEGAEFYDATGRVVYSRVEGASFFQDGIARLETGIQRYRVTIMCSEEDPRGCHRRLLVGRVLAARSVTLRHIRGDGRVECEDTVHSIDPEKEPDAQLTLFPDEQVREWKSLRSVLPRDQRRTSSEH